MQILGYEGGAKTNPTMLTRKTRETILVILIIVIPTALFVLIDEDLLQKMAFAALALGGASLFGIRKYLDRLDQAMRVLPDPAKGGQFDPTTMPLKPLERKLLGIDDIAHPERIRRALRDWRSLLVSIGMGFGVTAVIGLILLIVIYTY